MDVVSSSKFLIGITTVTLLLIFSSQVKAGERPWLSYIINPSFWFSGPVNKELSDSYYYSYNTKKIRYSPMGNWFSLGNSLIEQADVDTFEVLSRDFARDKNHIYFRSDIISNQVAYATFEVIEHLLVQR